MSLLLQFKQGLDLRRGLFPGAAVGLAVAHAGAISPASSEGQLRDFIVLYIFYLTVDIL